MLTRSTLRTINDDIDAALKAVGEKHNVVIKTGNATFSPANATVKVSIATVTADGVVETKERDDFRRKALRYGLPSDALDKVVMIAGRSFKVTGLNPRAKAYPVILTDTFTGKRYKYTVNTVSKALTA